jgi:multimeric flavodoxin WrbA
MRIIVLNGSPKGDLSVTMQYIHYIQKRFPEHDLRIINIAHSIKKIEKEDSVFMEVIDAVRSSDGVLWAFPLYYCLVPSQYKRFIELILEKKVEEVFKNRYAAVLTTSIHFFDHTAHNYMQAICDDLDMRYVGSYSAEMHDLLKEEHRRRLLLFAEQFFGAIENRITTPKAYSPLVHGTFTYHAGPIQKSIQTGGKKILVVTDHEDHQTTLVRMVEQFRDSFHSGVEVVNLNQVDIKGGCLGCLQCGYDNTCVYTGKDEFIEFFDERVKKADILVFAGSIRDRYLSSRWKMFFDRSFYNTHIPSLSGKQMGFLVSGPLSQIPNLRQIMEAYAELQQANLVNILTDECGDAATLNALIQEFAARLVWSANKGYMKPRTFLEVGGRKVFRDEIWSSLRFPFQADDRYYAKHGMYDFPHGHYKARMTSRLLILLTKIPAMRKEIYLKKLKTEMIKPLQKVVRDGK